MNNGFPLYQRLFAIFAFILYLNVFFFRSIGSTGFALIVLGLFIFVSHILKRSYSGKELLITALLFGTLTLFSVGIMSRANLYVNIVLGGVMIFLILLQGYILSSGIPMVRSLLELILAPFYVSLEYIKNAFRALSLTITGNYKELLPTSEDNKNTFFKSVALGLIIGIFVIGILVSMLTSADPIFAAFIENIFSKSFLKSLSTRIFFSIGLAVILAPFLIFRKNSTFNSPVQLFKRWNFVHGMSVIMALVAFVLGLFLVVQWPYVFVSVPFETDLSRFGVETYSEYVRKGFIELLRISLFIYGLIWIGLIFLREHKKVEKSFLPIIQSVVLIEFFIFLISIFRRVWLYQQYHGWSIVRMYGSFLLIWICGITIFLVLRHFIQKKWVIGEIIFTALILAVIGFFNVEQFIVSNHPPTVNKRVDYVYLSRMSADGYIGWKEAFNNAERTLDTYKSQESQFTRDQIRDIAYAGYITRELLEHQHDLILDYGTSNEKHQYLLQLIDFHQKAVVEVPLKDPAPENSGSYAYHIDEVTKIENTIKQKEYNSKIMFNSIRLNKSPQIFKYETQANSFMQPNSFYDINYYYPLLDNSETEKQQKEKSVFDKIAIFNTSRKSAYSQMKQDISYAELLELQKTYYELVDRIRTLPNNEREYDMDISLNSPLLD